MSSTSVLPEVPTRDGVGDEALLGRSSRWSSGWVELVSAGPDAVTAHGELVEAFIVLERIRGLLMKVSRSVPEAATYLAEVENGGQLHRAGGLFDRSGVEGRWAALVMAGYELKLNTPDEAQKVIAAVSEGTRRQEGAAEADRRARSDGGRDAAMLRYHQGQLKRTTSQGLPTAA